MTRELVLGGQRSGKSRHAESRAAAWLSAAPGHEALLLATALPWDDEMRERIARHREDRRRRLPSMQTQQVHEDLAAAVRTLADPRRLLVVDCLTLWLTQRMLPMHGEPQRATAVAAACDEVVEAVRASSGPTVLVSNEIGLGVIPPSPEARAFVDALGRLHQALASACDRVTLMVAGLPLAVKTEGTSA